ncbi:MAG TPA: radical SAM protein [Terriglobales bacterium]|nr:radical SAM protein [Terriglobales bacterium]
MKTLDRVTRHARLTWQNLAFPHPPTPPFLILFINSICNLTCEHCFYWRNLNRRDDLKVEEILALSEELGRIENLNLSGGEPFLRPEFAEICRFFIKNNGVEQIYVPTNGYFTERTINALESIFEEQSLRLFVCELSIDGMPEYHNRFRGNPKSFEKLIETYDALADLQAREPRLRIHSISTVTNENLDEVKQLTTYLYERFPAMDHHNLALIRGDRKNPSLQGPNLAAYQQLVQYARRVWAPREEQRYGALVEPMLQWAKIKTATQKTQVVPCRAGILSGVVYANGDVSFCETHPPLGNLRQKSFRKIWFSPEADALRKSVHKKECWCTNEVFLWPSITYQPVQLAKALVGSRAWEKTEALDDAERRKVLSGTPAQAAADLKILQ